MLQSIEATFSRCLKVLESLGEVTEKNVIYLIVLSLSSLLELDGHSSPNKSFIAFFHNSISLFLSKSTERNDEMPTLWGAWPRPPLFHSFGGHLFKSACPVIEDALPRHADSNVDLPDAVGSKIRYDLVQHGLTGWFRVQRRFSSLLVSG